MSDELEANTAPISVPPEPRPPMEGPEVYRDQVLASLVDVLREQNRIQRETNEILRDFRDEQVMNRRHLARFEDLLERLLQSPRMERGEGQAT
jgi:hypothetical protein